MESEADYYFNGESNEELNLSRLRGREFENVTIENVDSSDSTKTFERLTCKKLIIENCKFRNLRIQDCTIGNLEIRNVFTNSHISIVGYNIGHISNVFFNEVNALEIGLLCKLSSLSVYNTESENFNVIFLGQQDPNSYDLYFQENLFKKFSIKKADFKTDINFLTNKIVDFNVSHMKSVHVKFQTDVQIKKMTFNSCEQLEISNLYNIESNLLSFQDSKINHIEPYYDEGEDNFLPDKHIGEVVFNNCFIEKKVELSVIKATKIALANCNFDGLLHIKSVYKNVHVTPTMVVIEGKNLGKLLIEHINFDLKFVDNNSADVTIKNSGLKSIEFVDFVNQGDIKFINSSCSKKIFRNTADTYNSLIAKNSILDNINFHFFNLNEFKYIHLISTNISGLKLFHYPTNLISYQENLEVHPSIQEEYDFNLNARFSYNQLRLLAQRNGDTDVAVYYKSMEDSFLLKTKNDFWDRAVLVLNGWSNNHGSNWGRGVIFTLLSGFVSFLWYKISLGNLSFCILEELSDYIVYIISYPKLTLDNYQANQSGWNTSLARCFGLIFMGYGIYQTIVSFRKYGRS
jgi:hypothetical protein